jgi:ribosome-associated toxin RatA of RatAB toxin-antitoxin module
MPAVRRSALVPHAAAQMFELVNDIERYPEFLPWCSGARIVARSADQRDAMLTIANGRWQEQFTTRNVADAPHAIRMQLLEGPFRRLDGEWRFIELVSDDGAGGCKVSLALDFEMARPLLGHAIGGVFGRAASTMVDAFCARARVVYGAA